MIIRTCAVKRSTGASRALKIEPQNPDLRSNYERLRETCSIKRVGRQLVRNGALRLRPDIYCLRGRKMSLRKYAANPAIHLLLIMLVGLAAYSNTFHVPFIFDDYPNIVWNPLVKDLGNFIDFTPRHTAITNWLNNRSTGNFTLAINYYLHGFDVAGYHVFNLAVHLANGLLVYCLVYLTCSTPHFRSIDDSVKFAKTAALFSALIFVAHPLQTQAVTYIIQRYTSLAAFFYLFSLVMYVCSRLRKGESGVGSPAFRVVCYLLSLVSAVCAMKSKEIAFTLPILILLYEMLFLEGPLRRRLMMVLPLLLTLLIIPLSLIPFDSVSVGTLADIGEKTRAQSEMSRRDYLATELRVIVTYLRLMLVPTGQSIFLDYRISRSFLERDVLVSMSLLLTLAGVAFRLAIQSFKKTDDALFLRLIAFGIFWWFIALSVESSIIPIVDVMFEHRVYLPSVGLILAFTSAILLAVRKHRTAARIALPLLAGSVVVLAVATYKRNNLWTSNVSIWSDAAINSPYSTRIFCNIGDAYLRESNPRPALAPLIRSLELNPSNINAWCGMSQALEDMGIDGTLFVHKEKFLGNKQEADPPQMSQLMGMVRNNLGLAYEINGDYGNALMQYERSLKLYPGFKVVENNALSLCRQLKGAKEYSAQCDRIENYMNVK